MFRPLRKANTYMKLQSGEICITADDRFLVTHVFKSVSNVAEKDSGSRSSTCEKYIKLGQPREYGFFPKTENELAVNNISQSEGVLLTDDHSNKLESQLTPWQDAFSVQAKLTNEDESNGAIRKRSVSVYNFDRLDYATAWAYQKQIVEEFVRKGDRRGDMIMLLEHDPVFTIGRRPKFKYLNFDPASSSIKLYKVERGGEVTYHGPGQLVAYPLFDLSKFKKDLHWYLRQLEEVVIITLSRFGIVGWRDKEYTGVWVTTAQGPRKIAAIGSAVSKWKTYHGISLNVNVELEPFNMIVPCGIDGRGVINLTDLVEKADMFAVRLELIGAFEQVFDVGCSIKDSNALFNDLVLQYSQPDVIKTLS